MSTSDFLEIIIIFVVIAIVGGLIHCDLNHKIDEVKNSLDRSSLSRSTTNNDIHSINLYVRIIAYIALFFCVCVSIHYLAVVLPRILEAKAQNTHINNLGVDYLGLIVSIFAVIVTLLVGWQIYNAIEIRKEIAIIKSDFENRYGEKLKEVDEKINKNDLRKSCDIILAQIHNQLSLLYLGLSANGDQINHHMVYRAISMAFVAILNYLTHNETNEAANIVTTVTGMPAPVLKIEKKNKNILLSQISKLSPNHQPIIEPLRAWIQSVPEV